MLQYGKQKRIVFLPLWRYWIEVFPLTLLFVALVSARRRHVTIFWLLARLRERFGSLYLTGVGCQLISLELWGRFWFLLSSGDIVPRRKKVFASIVYGAVWFIWRARNDRVFNRLFLNPLKVVEKIKSETFVWIKHRSNRGNIDWCFWVSSPFSCL